MGIRKTHRVVLAFIKDYWRDHAISPTVREIITGLGRSQGSVQNSLKRLEENGDIRRIKRKSRNIRLLNVEMPVALPGLDLPGLPIRGEIAAGYCHDPFTESNEYLQEYLQIEYAGRKPDDYVLRVSGDSMVGAAIPNGSYVGIRRVPPNYSPKPGQIVAVWIEGRGTTLKHFYKTGSVVCLKAANPEYEPIIVDLKEHELKVQGAHLFTHWQSAVLA
ncbi:MAG: LexA family transcriptional regulator [Cyanobacteria bacterium J06650_10]